MPHPEPPVCQLRVASTSAGVVAAYIRQQRFEVGLPLTFDDQYEKICALEAFAGAFAAEIINGLRWRANKRRRELSQVEGVVNLWLENPLTYLDVVGEEGSPAIKCLRLQLFVNTLEAEPVIQGLLDETLQRSPLYLTLLKASEVLVGFQIAI